MKNTKKQPLPIFIISKYTYTYYLDGNQRTKTVAVDTSTYTYDDLNRLKTATLHDGG